ncbi:hypothetical protein Bca52824_041353 [Brassica carinata]|uniref:Uncharacterized protein n=1 Tax=Brassica carinata TaxID=52824 RepID=A0A8X7RZJ4_BRACI|nr:hypothetical protein Bca52824_041353 [Brassica carinata]
MLSATKLIKIYVLYVSSHGFTRIFNQKRKRLVKKFQVKHEKILNLSEWMKGKRHHHIIKYSSCNLCIILGYEGTLAIGKWLTSSSAHELAALSNTEAASQNMFHGSGSYCSYNNPYPMFISYLLLWLSLLYICEQNSNSVNVTAGSCECDRWRVLHSSSSKSSVASLEKSKASRTVAKFAVKHRRIMNSFDRRNPRLLEKSLSESKAPRLKDFENKKGKSHCT